MRANSFITEEQFKEIEDRMKKQGKGGVVGTRSQIAEKGAPTVDSRNTHRRSERGITKAGSNPATSPTTRPSPYKSKWESAYAHKLQLELLAGEISGWWYEPFSLWLPGQVRYKPDFLVQYPSGELYLLEVKGWSKNLRDGMTRLKIAASIFYCFKWCLVHRLKGGGWAHDVVGTKEGG